MSATSRCPLHHYEDDDDLQASSWCLGFGSNAHEAISTGSDFRQQFGMSGETQQETGYFRKKEFRQKVAEGGHSQNIPILQTSVSTSEALQILLKHLLS